MFMHTLPTLDSGRALHFLKKGLDSNLAFMRSGSPTFSKVISHCFSALRSMPPGRAHRERSKTRGVRLRVGAGRGGYLLESASAGGRANLRHLLSS